MSAKAPATILCLANQKKKKKNDKINQFTKHQWKNKCFPLETRLKFTSENCSLSGFGETINNFYFKNDISFLQPISMKSLLLFLFWGFFFLDAVYLLNVRTKMTKEKKNHFQMNGMEILVFCLTINGSMKKELLFITGILIICFYSVRRG